MKKIIFLMVLSCFFVSHVFADLVIEPYEEQCAKYIVTEESKKNYKDCIDKCNDDGVFCKMNCSGYGPEICLYTNGDKKNKTSREGILDINLKRLSIIYIFTIITLLLVMYYYPKIKNKSKIKQ